MLSPIDPDEVREFVSCRETSFEIGAAILELFPETADEVWDNPDEDDVARVVSRAWELADADEDTLCWGPWTSFTRDQVI